MSGWSLRPYAGQLVVLTLLAGLNAACSAREKPSDLGLRVGFVCDTDRARSHLLRLRVLVDSCDAQADALYEASLARGEAAPSVDGVAAGRYGVEATAYDGEEAVVAHTCLQVNLPRPDAIVLELRSAGCADDTPDAEVSPDANASARVERDAGATRPDGMQPPAVDDAASTCSTDCSDSDPCTDDLCVAGACTNLPFSGARECDGIPCTEGDLCDAGECQAGAPNHAACPDDGNPCSAETCVAGAGCNRSNADANGRSCNDFTDCTNPDTCNNGICAGTDTCSGGQVCSAAERICLACNGVQDCNDSNPCTNDSCSAGRCAHSNNTASCNDGKSCTGNDVCSGGSCGGSSTCPSDAMCGGSTCRCNDASETLCSGSNTCVNLTDSTSDCGLCGRACGTGSSCQNGACKPSSASACSAERSGGHDYLFCTDTLNWAAARDRCRGFGLVLGVVDGQSENDFMRDHLGGTPHWIGASDRGDEGTNCRLSREEGTWYWANGSSDNGAKLCTSASSGAVACTPEPGRYSNWLEGQPNNIYCDCNVNGCSEGQDCASMDANGAWLDDQCSLLLGYVCETP